MIRKSKKFILWGLAVTFIVLAVLAELALRYLTMDGGYPKNMREAGECFFGNYEAIYTSYTANILRNKDRMKIIDRTNKDNNQSYIQSNSEATKESNVLNATNAEMNGQLIRMKDKCDYFPKWD